ncbi:MAG: MBL fold metallo-hydrolase [Acidimicrobiia bacterium]
MRIDLSTDTTIAFAQQVTTASLGDHSYIVVVDGEAAAIDIQRDLDRFDNLLDGLDVDLVAVFETHIHNDYVSGGKRLADTHGATYVLPANTGASYPHTPLADRESIALGSWRLEAMHTPGHTFNHTSYVLMSSEGPVAIFSGGSLLVGAVGRSDLLGPDHTDALLADQFASAHRIADQIAGPSLVAPTHGSGSFCSASAVSDSVSTIALEKQRNPALLAPDAETFSAAQKAGYLAYPSYYAHMGPANLEPLGAPPATELPVVTDLDSIADAVVIDVRPFEEYAEGHVVGSLSVPVSNDAAVYLGWVLPWNSALILTGEPTDIAEVRLQLARIGWDNLVGAVDPRSLADIARAPLATTNWVRWSEFDLDGPPVVDVRDRIEQESGVIPEATAVHLSDFAKNAENYVDSDVVIHCQSGYRAAIAVGFAEAAGANVTVVRDNLSRVPVPLTKPV